MRLIIISGTSGSGKSTALHQLEDEGFFCIDNLPTSLLPALVERAGEDEFGPVGLAVCVDARNAHKHLEDFPGLMAQLPDSLRTDVVYMDADDDSLLQRFSETRRKHPLSNGAHTLAEALTMERELLETIAAAASTTIDTTSTTIHELRSDIRQKLAGAVEGGIALLFESFGFKRGLPADADIVYDLRVLPNPHWRDDLRGLTGRDGAVAGFLEGEADVERMFNDISAFLDGWLPRYRDNNRSYVTVALGCTGGRHRSVYLAERLYRRYRSQYPDVNIRHRELDN